MMTYEQIEQALKDRVLSVVSRESGVNRVTISEIKNGHDVNITRETQRKLSDYLQSTVVQNDG